MPPLISTRSVHLDDSYTAIFRGWRYGEVTAEEHAWLCEQIKRPGCPLWIEMLRYYREHCANFHLRVADLDWCPAKTLEEVRFTSPLWIAVMPHLAVNERPAAAEFECYQVGDALLWRCASLAWVLTTRLDLSNPEQRVSFTFPDPVLGPIPVKATVRLRAYPDYYSLLSIIDTTPPIHPRHEHFVRLAIRELTRGSLLHGLKMACEAFFSANEQEIDEYSDRVRYALLLRLALEGQVQSEDYPEWRDLLAVADQQCTPYAAALCVFRDDYYDDIVGTNYTDPHHWTGFPKLVAHKESQQTVPEDHEAELADDYDVKQRELKVEAARSAIDQLKQFAKAASKRVG